MADLARITEHMKVISADNRHGDRYTLDDLQAVTGAPLTAAPAMREVALG